MTASPLEQIIEEERRKIELGWAHEEQRAIELTEAEKWARDPIGWINAYVYIASKFNEAGQPAAIRTVKMTLFPDQEESLASWIDLGHLAATGELHFRNMALDKSRQIGETWGFMATIVWALLFHTVRGLVMSLRDAEVQDQGWTIDSLFGRAKFIYEHLDKQMPGLGHFHFKPGGKDPATITNTSRGSSVAGECQRDDPGRGKTYDFELVDEAAFIQHGERVYAALSESCKGGKALASTPYGDGNMHARIIDARPRGWRILRHHWSTHPIYSVGLHVAGEEPGCAMCEGNRQGIAWNAENPQAHRYPGKLTSPWYDEAVLDKTDSQVAQELDIDRAGALVARVYPEFAADVHVLPELSLPPQFSKLEFGWDFGSDVTSIVICEDTPAEYALHGCVELGGKLGTSATASLVAAAIRAFCADVLGLDPEFLTPNWTRRWYCVGDASGAHAANPNALPEFEEYRKVGFEIVAPPQRLINRAETNIRAVQRLLLGHPKPLRVSQATAGNFIIHARNNVWPTDAVGNRRIGATTPEDDLHNHAMRAFAYLVVTKFEPPDERERQGHDPREDLDEMISGGLSYGMTL